MEEDAFLGTHRGIQSLTPVTWDTDSLEALPELVSLMEYGQGVQLHARISPLPNVINSLVRLLMYACSVTPNQLTLDSILHIAVCLKYEGWQTVTYLKSCELTHWLTWTL